MGAPEEVEGTEVAVAGAVEGAVEVYSGSLGSGQVTSLHASGQTPLSY